MSHVAQLRCDRMQGLAQDLRHLRCNISFGKHLGHLRLLRKERRLDLWVAHNIFLLAAFSEWTCHLLQMHLSSVDVIGKSIVGTKIATYKPLCDEKHVIQLVSLALDESMV